MVVGGAIGNKKTLFTGFEDDENGDRTVDLDKGTWYAYAWGTRRVVRKYANTKKRERFIMVDVLLLIGVFCEFNGKHCENSVSDLHVKRVPKLT